MAIVRALLVAALLVLLAGPAAASPNTDGRLIDQQLTSGRQLRRAGQVLVGLGCVAALLATVIGPMALEIGHPTQAVGRYEPPLGAPMGVAALTAGAFAAAAIGTGIPLFAEGDARRARARLLIDATRLRITR